VVRFNPYWLASVRVAYRLTGQLEAHLRVAMPLTTATRT
jgi:hypothetical protein